MNATSSSSSPAKEVKHRKVGIPKFLRYLYQMLETEDPAIIAWAFDGSSIQILDLHAVANVVLPKYFKHSNYASFQRQLNYFGFRKWTKSQTNICTFSHPEFRQNRPDRLCLIKRKNRPERSNVQARRQVPPSFASPGPWTMDEGTRHGEASKAQAMTTATLPNASRSTSFPRAQLSPTLPNSVLFNDFHGLPFMQAYRAPPPPTPNVFTFPSPPDDQNSGRAGNTPDHMWYYYTG
ncbi:hypothetical protein SDRG_01683 [Saprolegnia diclina VS20]|uniref:HSF-type DNA-binding domain-containing protein n=1 Tax=Saprolegnia diclina (strain VS20) TaxID=1156394 RepID=T0S8V4_SAPDV|nr:hypothetical protein SDRG_01683 [Saprolegnia diclina VS20]EQC41728.1 hypothetical protein SDRG_01683 [Saprolegnia diclina VS20]|eukprot:XP_008605442.1 hypothetical protein SDRG_01683 [Saprolegnia diclina VS20]